MIPETTWHLEEISQGGEWIRFDYVSKQFT